LQRRAHAYNELYSDKQYEIKGGQGIMIMRELECFYINLKHKILREETWRSLLEKLQKVSILLVDIPVAILLLFYHSLFILSAKHARILNFI